MNTQWCAISFTLPRTPSKARVSAWRKIKQAGAVSIGQSVWILPNGKSHLETLEEIGRYVESNGGRYLIFNCGFQKPDDEIITFFNKERDEEYNELLDKCDDFFVEIERETAKQNFCFGELEENEQELEKLNLWLEKIIKRDFFGSALMTEAKNRLYKCKEVFDKFSDKVFDENTLREAAND